MRLSSSIGVLSWAVRQSAEVENAMTAVEDMAECIHLPSEAQDMVQTEPGGDGGGSHGAYGKCVEAAANGGAGGLVAPPPGWPAAGALAFKGVVARYKPELRAVLDGVSFELQPGNMMGVVRGGAAQAGPT